MSNSLAHQTIATVDAALKSGQIASMPELVRIIRALSSDEGKVSISELAEMINQDSTVLMRVIAAANTFGYNPTNIEISTVSEAIHTIGFNRVRMLSMSLMLLEQAGRHGSPFEQRQMASISLCSGFIAQVTAEHAGLIDPELAFVCASLRNFGRLLLGTFLTEDFRAATAAAERGEGDTAFTDRFGLTPFELGHQMLKTANLPPIVLNAIRQYEHPSSAAVSWSERSLQRVSAFALSLSELSLNPTISDARFAREQTALVQKVRIDFPFLVERAPNLLREVEQRLSVLNIAAGTSAIGRVSRDRLRHRARRTPLNGTPDMFDALPTQSSILPASYGEENESLSFGNDPNFDAIFGPEPLPPSTTLNSPSSAVPDPSVPRSAIDDALANLATVEPNQNPLPIALNAVWTTLRPRDLLFCTLDRSGRTFRISIGNGPLNDRLGDRTLFGRLDRNVFYLCHDRLINLSIKNTEDPRVWSHLPYWMKTAGAPRSLLAVPVHHQRQLQGILVIAWAHPRTTSFSKSELAPLQALFDLVANRSFQRT